MSAKPPSLPRWILERLSPAEDTAALAGDLIEEFERGRSVAWFWRQALAAVVIAWYRSLRGHRAALAFAALWSILAPGWVTLIDGVFAESPIPRYLRNMLWPWSAFAEFVFWMLLNLAFIWTGILLYISPKVWLTRRLSFRELRRVFLLTATLFNVIDVAMFLLLSQSGHPPVPWVDRRTITPLSEVVDIHLWALVVRIPYFLAMVCALWRTAADFGSIIRRPIAVGSGAGATAMPESMPEPEVAFLTPRLVISGCIAAAIVECLLCGLPIDRVVSSIGLLPAAVFFVVEAVLAGAIGAVLIGLSSQDRSWKRLLIVAITFGPAWVWVAPAFLLGYHDSVWALPVTATGAAMLAIGLRRIGPQIVDEPDATKEMFSATLQPIPWDWHASAIAVSIYAAFLSVQTGQIPLACALSAACAYLFASQWVSAPRFAPRLASRFAPLHLNSSGRSARSLLATTLPALIITILVMRAAIHSRDAGLSEGANLANHSAKAAAPKNAQSVSLANALGSYQSIVLWPDPPKKQLIVPISLLDLAPADLMKRQVIRFNGAYWYFQAPGTHPDSHSHVARGNPLNVNIHSTNFGPITMEADQMLARPIRISRCGQISVSIDNRDNAPGQISIGLLLTDSSSPHRSTLYLGERAIESSLPIHFSIKLAPVTETLKFSLPAHARIRQFDEITFIVNSDPERLQNGAKIAIEELELMPR